MAALSPASITLQGTMQVREARPCVVQAGYGSVAVIASWLSGFTEAKGGRL
jgi:hypothetical protein